MAQTVLSKLKFVIGADNKQFLSSIQQSQRKIVGFQSGIAKFAKVAGAAFAGAAVLRGITNFALEAKELGEQATAIVPAFERLGRPGLLADLVKSTSQTVGNLELMKQAIRASNFQIPLEQLGKLFQFAQIRAKETGESVDFLVNSIISGIGRKSPLILDNLGISAVRLRRELKGVGTETSTVGQIAAAVGAIIDEEMGIRGGAAISNVALASERLETSITNLKAEIGDKLAPTTAKWTDSFREGLESLPVRELTEAFGVLGTVLAKIGGAALAPLLAPFNIVKGLRKSFSSTPAQPSGSFNNVFGAGSLVDSSSLSSSTKASSKFIAESLTNLKLINATAGATSGLLAEMLLKQSQLEALKPTILDEAKLAIVNRELQAIGVGLNNLNTIGTTTNIDKIKGIGFGSGVTAPILPEKIGTVIPTINTQLSETVDLTRLLGNGFTGMFDALINGANGASGVLRGLFGVLGGVVGGLIGGPAGIAIGSQIGGSLGSAVTRGGDIKHSGALVSRNRSFSN